MSTVLVAPRNGVRPRQSRTAGGRTRNRLPLIHHDIVIILGRPIVSTIEFGIACTRVSWRLRESSMNPFRHTLLNARKSYSRCASKVESRIKSQGLTSLLSEQIIGIGVAADWLRRAAELEGVTYLGNQLNESKRNASFVEILRYSFSWFGLNAIFTRPMLLNLIGTPQGHGEFTRFLVLFNSAALPSEPTLTVSLQGLLAAQTSPRLPNRAPGTSVSVLSAIYVKYLSATGQQGQTATAVANAATSGNISNLNLPTLLYAFRNWSVHGNALDGAFGSRPGFLRYVELLQTGLAEIHDNTAAQLLARI